MSAITASPLFWRQNQDMEMEIKGSSDSNPACNQNWHQPSTPQVTLWQKKIKSRCVIKGLSQQGATSCWSEHLLFGIQASIAPTIQRQLDFPHACALLFYSVLLDVARPHSLFWGGLWPFRPSSIFCLLQEQEWKRDSQDSWELEEDLSLLLEGARRLWNWTWLQ